MTYTTILAKLGITVFASFPLLFTPTIREEELVDTVIVPVVASTTSPVVAKKIKKSNIIQEDCLKYKELIASYDWPYEIAMKVCSGESGGNPGAINWADKHKNSRGEIICVSSRGLFQIACFYPNKLGYEYDDLLIPSKNIEMAYKIWQTQGWCPWSVYKNTDECG